MTHPDQHPRNITTGPVEFESLESRLFMRVEGVDVSLFQGAINWQTLRNNNKEFAFVRSSRTNLDLDANFNTNMANAKAAGVITGPYQRVLPLGESDGGAYTDPITDANRFYNAAGAYMTAGYLRPVIDVEDGYTLGKATLSQWVMDFSNELERLSGVEPIIYCNANYATNYLTDAVAARHDLWIARWNNGNDPSLVNPQTDQPQTPTGWANPYGVWNVPVGGAPSNSSWDFWQYSSRGNGIALGVSSTNLDLDVFNGDMETLKRGFYIGYQWNYPNGNPFSVGPAITTTIQAEDYDNGGQGYAFNDTTPKLNSGGVYRTGERDGVDLKLIANTTNQYRIGDAFPGEWAEYTINVQQAGNYKTDLRLSQADPNAKVHLEVDGASVGTFNVPDTNSFSVFTTVTKTIALGAGKHVLRLAFDQAAVNHTVAGVDWLRLAPAPVSKTISSTIASYVRNGIYAGSNFGNDASLIAKRSSTVGNTRESYIRFDLSSLSSITSATLRLTGRLSAATAGGVLTNIYNAANTTWSETGLTWNNKPAAGTTLRGAITVNGTTNATYSVDLTNFLKSEFAAGRKVVTLVLKNPNVTDAYSIFGSDDSGTPPQLVVT